MPQQHAMGWVVSSGSMTPTYNVVLVVADNIQDAVSIFSERYPTELYRIDSINRELIDCILNKNQAQYDPGVYWDGQRPVNL